MDILELCLCLNKEGLTAELLRDVPPTATADEIMDDLRAKELITPERAEKVLRACADGWAEEEAARAEKSGTSLIVCCDEAYPQRLWDLPDPPLVLYVRGKLPDFDSAWSVVGTRRCSSYATKVAEQLGSALGRAGLPVISGGAYGIDGAAHRGALSQDGVTVVVFGNGIDIVYPAEHEAMFAQITEKGALVSEFPFGTQGRRWTFPKRNRIIAALSRGLIVVESPLKGGSMITARLVTELDRELWAVPGRIGEKICEGSNALLRDGAYPLVNITDFIDTVCHFEQTLLFDLPPRQSDAPLGDDEKKVLDCLRGYGDLTVDQIAARTGIDALLLMSALTMLQADGRIYASGGRWHAVPR